LVTYFEAAQARRRMLVDRTLVDADGKFQKEADQLGIQYAWKSGFDPRGFVTFLDSI